MQVTRSTLAAFVLLALSSAPAFAATYYCDNDRNAASYPHCYNSEGWDPAPVHHVAWTYRGGQGSDWNGDDRVNTHAAQYYIWYFDKQAAFRYSAWLANNAFTDPRARYTVASYSSSSGWHNTIIATINQNTARSGWNPLGSKAVTSREIDVRASGSGRAGADIVRAVSSSSAASVGIARLEEEAPGVPNAVLKAPALPVRPLDPEVAAIRAKMLTAVDRYRDASGTFDAVFSNSGQDETVTFESSQARRASVVEVADHAAGRVSRYVSDGLTAKTLDPASHTYVAEDLPSVSDMQVGTASPAARSYVDENGTPVYLHRMDPADAMGADDVLNPENYAFWLDGSDAHVVDHQKLAGRKVNVIAGHHDAYLRDKLGASVFRMWVDDATGVLLKLTGTDASGKLVYAIDVRDIHFNTGATDLAAKLAVPAGFTRIAAHAAGAPAN
jgi:hypothetical protein